MMLRPLSLRNQRDRRAGVADQLMAGAGMTEAHNVARFFCCAMGYAHP
jgi:hypothetical protein